MHYISPYGARLSSPHPSHGHKPQPSLQVASVVQQIFGTGLSKLKSSLHEPMVTKRLHNVTMRLSAVRAFKLCDQHNVPFRKRLLSDLALNTYLTRRDYQERIKKTECAAGGQDEEVSARSAPRKPTKFQRVAHLVTQCVTLCALPSTAAYNTHAVALVAWVNATRAGLIVALAGRDKSPARVCKPFGAGWEPAVWGPTGRVVTGCPPPPTFPSPAARVTGCSSLLGPLSAVHGQRVSMCLHRASRAAV